MSMPGTRHQIRQANKLVREAAAKRRTSPDQDCLKRRLGGRNQMPIAHGYLPSTEPAIAHSSGGQGAQWATLCDCGRARSNTSVKRFRATTWVVPRSHIPRPRYTKNIFQPGDTVKVAQTATAPRRRGMLGSWSPEVREATCAKVGKSQPTAIG